MARKLKEPETAVIGSTTHDGRGIADVPGKTVFVAGALEGEEVRYVRRRSHRRFDEAELVEVLRPAPERVEARCAAFGRCGGCALQHVSGERQRAIKFSALAEGLSRIGGVEPRRWLTPLTGPDWTYRRRARLAVKDVAAKGRVLVGFRERHAPFVTDMHRCEVLAPPADALIDPLSELVGKLSIRARVPQIEVAVADNAAALVFRVLDPPTSADRDVLCRFGERHGLRLYLQPGGPDSLELLFPAAPVDPLVYGLPGFGLEIAFEPVDFVQINRDVNERLVSAAIELLDVGAGHRVLDLYCGIGNFSLPLAKRAASVLGVEGEAALVERAAANAERNGLDNASFRRADLATIQGDEAWFTARCDRLLLDPARNGAADVVRHIAGPDPSRIVYVSCHPGTLARDAGTLVHDAGYELEAAGIVDMFPHTAHVESIAVFRK